MDLQFWGLYPAWFDVINFIRYIEAKPHSLVREVLSAIDRKLLAMSLEFSVGFVC